MTTRSRRLLFILCFIPLGLAAWLIPYFIFRGPLEGEKYHDFGVVLIERPHTIVEHVFQLRNRTGHTLQLVNAKPTCGCTTTEWPKEPVSSGELLVIPVQLKLQRSRLRRSVVHLEFATGETATLHIEGVGRFSQPLSVTPPDLELSPHSPDGARGVLRLEWYGKGEPPQPLAIVPEGVKIEYDKWHFSKDSDPYTQTPQIWTILMYVFHDGGGASSGVVGITVGDSPQLELPYVTLP